MNHKRGRARNKRAGCKLCKPWKINGAKKNGRDLIEKYSDFKRRHFADAETGD